MSYNKYTPTHEPINLLEPKPIDLKIDESLKAYMDIEMKLETDAEMIRRQQVVARVEEIFLSFVRRVAMEKLHMPEDEAFAAGGKLFVSGSHKLGVREPGADIDAVCVAPNFCTREHFFTLLKEVLVNHPSVTEFNSIETALVPVMSFDFDRVSIDLLFARMVDNVVPSDLDILDDSILEGLDEVTEISLNGPRVTMMISELVGKSTFPNFLIVLRCVRRWAKRRGLYGNKLGYMGGVNCNILVAFICQLYPNASPSTLLVKFFRVYSQWQWPKPVMLNQIMPAPPTRFNKKMPWSETDGLNYRHQMPIITPAYPAMNSSEKVTLCTRMVMKQEMVRAYNTLKQILKERDIRSVPSSSGAQQQFTIDWGRLFEPSDFFVKYSHYLACHIIGTGDNAESRQWIGFVESRILSFSKLLEYLPLMQPIHLFPIVSRTQKSANSCCYFIGFEVDKKAVNKREGVRVDETVEKFKANLWDEIHGFKGPRVEGLEFTVEHLPWKRLPKSVFDSLGGFEAAKAKRQAIVSAALTATTTPTTVVPTDATATSVAAPGGSTKSAPATPGVAGDTAIESDTSMKVEPDSATVATMPAVVGVDINDSAVIGDSVEGMRKRTRSEEAVSTVSASVVAGAITTSAMGQNNGNMNPLSDPKRVRSFLPPFAQRVYCN